MDKQGPLNVTCRIHASHRCCFIVATGAVTMCQKRIAIYCNIRRIFCDLRFCDWGCNDVPKAYCDILQYTKDILRFYHNILFIIFFNNNLVRYVFRTNILYLFRLKLQYTCI